MKETGLETIARGVIILTERLLVCRALGSERCYLPGGHVDHGEDGHTALNRELHEELGLLGRSVTFAATCEHSFIQKSAKVHEWSLVFNVSLPEDTKEEALCSKESHIEFEWIPIRELSERGLEPSCLIPWLEEGGPIGAFLSTMREV